MQWYIFFPPLFKISLSKLSLTSTWMERVSTHKHTRSSTHADLVLSDRYIDGINLRTPMIGSPSFLYEYFSFLLQVIQEIMCGGTLFYP